MKHSLQKKMRRSVWMLLRYNFNSQGEVDYLLSCRIKRYWIKPKSEYYRERSSTY